MLRPGRAREHLVAVFVQRNVLERDHVRRALARLGELELADLGLQIPRVVRVAFDPGVAQPHGVRARQPAVLDGMARTEDQIVEPRGPGLERVLEVIGDLHDRVAGANLTDCLVLPEEPRAAEDVIDLLRAAVRVRRRRQLSRLDPNPVDADPPGSGRIAGNCQVAAIDPFPGDGLRPCPSWRSRPKYLHFAAAADMAAAVQLGGDEGLIRRKSSWPRSGRTFAGNAGERT